MNHEPVHHPGFVRNIKSHVISVEMVFSLFFYSNHLEPIIQFFYGYKIELTLPFLILSVIPVMFVLYRKGLYVPGFMVFVAGMTFFFFVIMSQLWSPSRLLARRETLMILTGGLWSLLVPSLVISSERARVHRFLVITVFFSLIISIFSWHLIATYGEFVFSSVWKDEGVATIYQKVGRTAALGAVTALAFVIFSPLGSRAQFGWLAITALCFSLTLTAGARLAMVGVAIGALVLALGLPVRIGRRRLEISRGHIGIIFVTLVGIAVVLYLQYIGVNMTTVERMQKLLIEIEVGEGIFERYNRPNYLRIAWDLWMSSPIFGVGLMGFTVIGFMQEVNTPGIYPHNVFAQILAETGLVGLALFLLFLWSAYRHFSWKRMREDPLYLTVLAASTIPWAIAMFSGSFGQLWKLYAFIPLAVLPPATPATETPMETGSRADPPRLPVRH